MKVLHRMVFGLLVLVLPLRAGAEVVTLESLAAQVKELAFQVERVMRLYTVDLEVGVSNALQNSVNATPKIGGGFMDRRISYWKLNATCGEGVSMAVTPSVDFCKVGEFRVAVSSFKNPRVPNELFSGVITNTTRETRVVEFTLTSHSSMGATLGTDTVGVVVGSRP